MRFCKKFMGDLREVFLVFSAHNMTRAAYNRAMLSQNCTNSMDLRSLPANELSDVTSQKILYEFTCLPKRFIITIAYITFSTVLWVARLSGDERRVFVASLLQACSFIFRNKKVIVIYLRLMYSLRCCKCQTFPIFCCVTCNTIAVYLKRKR
jgi:hypothetical protein